MAEKLMVLAAGSGILMGAVVSASADVERIYGKAVNADGGFEFFEEHLVMYENDRIASIKTTYYDAGFIKIGEQASDFSQGPQFGSYDFKDERLRYRDGARVMSDRILIYCKETPGGDTKKKYLPRESSQIVGHGFDQFIAANLDSLIRGDVISAKLVLPAQMDQFDIRIRKHKIKGNRIFVKIELDNWFLRLFTPYAEAEYDLSNRRLLSYQGVAMMADASGKTIQVAVSYDYSRQQPLQSSRIKTEVARFERR